MTDPRSGSVAEMLADIESRVLEDMWIGRGRRLIVVALTALLPVSVALWWTGNRSAPSVHDADRVSIVATVVLTLPVITSAAALIVRRFRYCCAAAYTGGVSAVIGIGAFWWHRTGQAQATPLWLSVADVSVVLLTLGWLSVVATPIERSQPEMRASNAADDR
ncbi:hypothetical protein [Mycolicibacterium chubuense]|uniref:hypothetical protein n=1 Tax=Mycolicibacterium chubuense TaxID=1800 RepID=UPI001301613E|nr:hypothetical protein [Mycolicibacterium chubuense]